MSIQKAKCQKVEAYPCLKTSRYYNSQHGTKGIRANQNKPTENMYKKEGRNIRTNLQRILWIATSNAKSCSAGDYWHVGRKIASFNGKCVDLKELIQSVSTSNHELLWGCFCCCCGCLFHLIDSASNASLFAVPFNLTLTWASGFL